ncbi:hypothetical protein BA952_01430 [Candidatus Portiera aleyrodidarum]|nr:hypothetical protein BA952_01430 [Candidatus Portiera aleyrodidarum]
MFSLEVIFKCFRLVVCVVYFVVRGYFGILCLSYFADSCYNVVCCFKVFRIYVLEVVILTYNLYYHYLVLVCTFFVFFVRC